MTKKRNRDPMRDFAPNHRLQCGSPAHPKGVSTDTMYFLEERNGFFVFACRLCTELLRRPQIHVISLSHGAVRIYKNTRKAAVIDRDNQGKIVSFR